VIAASVCRCSTVWVTSARVPIGTSLAIQGNLILTAGACGASLVNGPVSTLWKSAFGKLLPAEPHAVNTNLYVPGPNLSERQPASRLLRLIGPTPEPNSLLIHCYSLFLKPDPQILGRIR
jgi:hypothetical protein